MPKCLAILINLVIEEYFDNCCFHGAVINFFSLTHVFSRHFSFNCSSLQFKHSNKRNSTKRKIIWNEIWKNAFVPSQTKEKRVRYEFLRLLNSLEQWKSPFSFPSNTKNYQLKSLNNEKAFKLFSHLTLHLIIQLFWDANNSQEGDSAQKIRH